MIWRIFSSVSTTVVFILLVLIGDSNLFSTAHTLFIVIIYGMITSCYSIMSLILLSQPEGIIVSESAEILLSILPYIFGNPVFVIFLCFIISSPLIRTIPYIIDMCVKKTYSVKINSLGLYPCLYVCTTIFTGLVIGTAITYGAAATTCEPTLWVSGSGIAIVICGILNCIFPVVVQYVYESRRGDNGNYLF